MENRVKVPMELIPTSEIEVGMEVTLKSELSLVDEFNFELIDCKLTWTDEMYYDKCTISQIDRSDNTFLIEEDKEQFWYHFSFIDSVLLENDGVLHVNPGRYKDLLDKERFLENLYNNGLATFRGYDKALADTYEQRIKEESSGE